MKKLSFQRLRKWVAALMLCLFALHASAQQHNIVITGTPETKCILPNEGPYCLDEFPKTLVACQGTEVVYTAHFTIASSDFAVGWDWEVSGGNITYTLDNLVKVQWGNDETGELMVTVTTDSGRVLTHHQTVHLIAPPVVAAITVPTCSYDHEITVCSGESVEFTDNSDARGSDIAGYFWSGPNGDASTRTFTVENILSNCVVTHRVYNNCGCYDEETFQIWVNHGDPLRIDCYGTACEGSTVTYHALSPSCTDYQWTVEGGTPVAGQHTSDITVLWDSPRDGYGIVSIDGTACGSNACQNKMSVKIPIIQNGVSISGPTTVCQGEGCVYSVPLFGSTAYEWTISPNINPVVINGANQIEYIFTMPGTYQLYVKYKCEFLECGEFTSLPLTIEVKPRLSIVGDDEMCITNIGVLTTEPPDNASWVVYEEGNPTPIYVSPNLEPSPHPTFTTPGRYKVIAWNNAYCNDAEFFLTVKEGPPAPTASDMDPNNPTIACPNSFITLKSNISNPFYSTVWIPVCSGVTPDTVSGKEVDIRYGSTVCNVNVHTYDRRLQCLSANAYTHVVKPFSLEPVNITTPITVCPGTRIEWTAANVPPQQDVIYEWRLQENRQYCATIEGDIYQNTATLLVNNFDPVPTTRLTFQVQLIRTYCSGIKDTTKIPITIADLRNSTIQIDPFGPICQNSEVAFSGSGCNDLKWYFSGSSSPVSGSSVNHKFDEEGVATIIVSCNPYDFCRDTNYLPHITIDSMVHPLPPAFSVGYNVTHVYTVPQLSTTDYTFQWNHTTVNDWRVPADPNVTHYTCTVTEINSPHCSKTVDNDVSTCGHLDVVQVGTLDYCTKEVTFRVLNPPGQIYWDLDYFTHGAPSYSGTYNEVITVPVTSVGNHTIYAGTSSPDPCNRGGAIFTVDFIQNFTFEKRCDSIVVRNKSKYLDGTKTATLLVNNLTQLTFPVNKDTVVVHTGTGGAFSFTLTDYDGHTPNCNLGSVSIANSAGQPVTITSANTNLPDQTCNNTAIELTATFPSSLTIANAHWNFDDYGSCIDTVGNTVFHTFAQRYSPYNVSLTITDENGCASGGSFSIKSNVNDLKDERLGVTSTPYPICPGGIVDIEYWSNNGITSSPIYYWSTMPSPDYSNIHQVSYTDDYSVIVKNDNYCEARASVNVGFKNKPEAFIIPKKYQYCIGEKIELSCMPGNGGNYEYTWNVTSPYDNSTTIDNTGKISFPTPPFPCTITVTLTVRDLSTQCVSDQALEFINVSAPPQAPSISIGNNRYCIGDPPVELVCNDPGLDVYWSNGDYGDVSSYFYSGYATAHYYDPISGCRSELAEIRIPAAPDFDALLTGCYKICSEKFPITLPVYGLLPINQSFNFEHFYNGIIFLGGYFTYIGTPLYQHPNGFGIYDFNVNYYNDCHADSKPLVLQEDSVCRCDSIEVTCSGKYYMQGCSIIYNVTVTVCNKSSRSVCFTSLTPLFGSGSGITMTSTDFTSLSIAPYDCTTFQINLSVTSLASPSAMFRMRDRNCVDCEKVFSVDLRPLWEDLNINCSPNVAAANGSVAERGSLSDVQKFYYDFDFDLSSIFTSPSVIAVWSSPGTVIDYSMSTSFHLSGLGVFDRSSWNPTGTLCIHALVCDNGQPCIVHYCITMMNIVLAPSLRHLAGNEKSLRQDAVTSDVTEPQLIPNPTTGDVSIVGTSDEVEEVLVMDMNGRKMATFDKTDHFNVTALPSGIYIVRVKTRHHATAHDDAPQEAVTYLKLVKK